MIYIHVFFFNLFWFVFCSKGDQIQDLIHIKNPWPLVLYSSYALLNPHKNLMIKLMGKEMNKLRIKERMAGNV